MMLLGNALVGMGVSRGLEGRFFGVVDTLCFRRRRNGLWREIVYLSTFSVSLKCLETESLQGGRNVVSKGIALSK